MKLKTKIAAATAIVSIFLISCGEGTPAEKPGDNVNNKKALEEVKKEQKVKDAVITDANVLYVSVEDDGTKRDGYAKYLCGILAEQQATTKWVKIIKHNSLNEAESDKAYGVLIGESKCE